MNRRLASIVSIFALLVGAGCVEHEASKVCNDVTDTMCMALRLTGELGPLDEVIVFAMVSQKIDTTEFFTRSSGMAMQAATDLPLEVPITWELNAPFTAPDLDLIVWGKRAGTIVGVTSFQAHPPQTGKLAVTAPLELLTDSKCYNGTEDALERDVDCGTDPEGAFEPFLPGYSKNVIAHPSFCIPCAKGKFCYENKTCLSGKCDLDNAECL